jgi:hypothetical protein
LNDLTLSLISAVILGIGATFTFDLWALFLRFAFTITPSNFCLVGRWLLYLPEGTIRHSSLASAPRKNTECTMGWIAHYIIGVIFAIAFVAFAGRIWLQFPTPIPAIIFGLVTVLAPFFIMQPLFGLGFAASKMSNPMMHRLRSVLNHMAFGVGLYLFGLLVNWLLWVNP